MQRALLMMDVRRLRTSVIRTPRVLWLSVAMLVPLALVAQAPTIGYRMRVAVTTSTSAASGGSKTNTQQYTVRVRDGMARVDVTPSPGRSYMLLDAGTGMLHYVDPAQREVASTPDVERVAEEMSELRVTDTSSSVVDLGPGDRILGLPTRRYRVRLGYTVRMSAVGQELALGISSDSELLVSDSAATLDPAFRAFDTRFLRSPVHDTRGAYASPALRQLLQGWPQGVTLRGREVHRVIVGGRDTLVTRFTIRTDLLQRAAVPSAAMVIPTGYARSMSNLQPMLGFDERPTPPAPRRSKKP